MKKNVINYVMGVAALFIISSITQGGCCSGDKSAALSHDDSLKIASVFCNQNAMYPKQPKINKNDSSSEIVFRLYDYYPPTDVAETYRYADTFKWAQRCIQYFRDENNISHALMADSKTPLNAYFIPIDDINNLLKTCTTQRKTVTGLRLYFGKLSNLPDNKGIYTHFIFATEKSTVAGSSANDDIRDAGFVEQIKPCPTPSGSSINACSTKDILIN